MADSATGTLNVVLPLVTGSVGLASGVVLEWLRDKRTYERERVARDDARRDKQTEQRHKLIEQRNDLQRQTFARSASDAVRLIGELAGGLRSSPARAKRYSTSICVSRRTAASRSKKSGETSVHRPDSNQEYQVKLTFANVATSSRRSPALRLLSG
jgi:hypothetical protein